MRHFISVRRESLKENQAEVTSPPIRVVTEGKEPVYAYDVMIAGPSDVVYRPGKPLFGAEVWVETSAAIHANTQALRPYLGDEPEMAAGTCSAVKSRKPLTPETGLHRLLASGLLEQAARQMQARLAKSPGDFKLMQRLGETLRKLGRLTEAGSVYQELARLRPGDLVAERLACLLLGQSTQVPPSWPVIFKTVPNCLRPELLEQLLEFTKSCESTFLPTPVMAKGIPTVVEQVRRSSSVWELAELGPALEREVLARLQAISTHLPGLELDLVLEGCKLTRYGDGAFFKPHVDRGPGAERRLYGFILYFNYEPQRFEGGVSGLAI
jgi:hypothetical protein